MAKRRFSLDDYINGRYFTPGHADVVVQPPPPPDLVTDGRERISRAEWIRRHTPTDLHLTDEDCRGSAADPRAPVDIHIDRDTYYEDETYLNRVWAADRRPLAQLHAIHRNSFTRGADGRPGRRLQRNYGKKANVR